MTDDKDSYACGLFASLSDQDKVKAVEFVKKLPSCVKSNKENEDLTMKRTAKNSALVALAASLISLTACNQSYMTRPPPQMAGQPPAWNEGYRAGCASGKNAAGNPYFAYEKDVKRGIADPVYKDGWDSGYDVCKTEYLAIRQGM